MACSNNVLITHFINPHLFWYHELNTPEYEDTKAIIAGIERKLSENSAHNKSNWQRLFNRQPDVGEIIVVHYIPWQRFIRGRVDEIAQFRSTAEEFIVWAIDYGFPFQTKLDHVHVMPKELSTPIQHIKRGGLANLLPAEKEFLHQKSVVMCTSQWHHKACDIVAELVLQNNTVLFAEQFQVSDHHWGDLKIINNLGKEDLASKLLLERQFAKEINNFKQVCGRLKSVRIYAWLNNNGNCNYKYNRCTGLPLKDENIQARMLITENPDSCERKVMDWLQRLKIADKKEEMEKTDNANKTRSCYLGVNMLTKHMSADTALNKLLEDKQRALAKPQDGIAPKFSKEAILALNEDINFELNSSFEEIDENIMNNNSANESSSSSKKELFVNTSTSSQCENNKSLQGKSRTEVILELKHAYSSLAVKSNNDTETTQDTSLEVANACDSIMGNRRRSIAEKRKKFLETKAKDDAKAISVKETDDEIFEVSGNVQLEVKSSSEIETDNLNSVSKKSSRIKNLANLRKKFIAIRQTDTSSDDIEKKGEYVNQGYDDVIFKNQFKAVPAGLEESVREIRNLDIPIRQSSNKNLTKENKTTIILDYENNSSASSKKTDISVSGVESCQNDMENCKKPQTNCAVFQNNFKVVPAGLEASVREIRNSDIYVSKGNLKYQHVQRISNSSTSSKEQEIKYKRLKNVENNLETSTNSESYFAAFNTTSDSSCGEIPFSKLLPSTHNKHEKDVMNSTMSNYDSSKSDSAGQTTTNDSSKITSTDSSGFLANASIESGAIGDDENAEVTPECSSLRALIAFRNEEILRKKKLEEQQNDTKQYQQNKKEQAAELSNNTNQLTVIANEHTFEMNFIDQLVLVHSREQLHSVKRLENAMLHHKIYHEMIRMNIRKLYRIQSYAWSHLVLLNSVFIVSAIKTGKTWAYIPQICHLVTNYLLMQKANREKSAPIYGPVALILVASAQHVEYVANICQRLLLNLASDIFVTVAACYGMRNASQVKVQLLNGCGILIATPASLWRLIADTNQAPLLSATRLQHIIIDDLDLILSRSNIVFDQVLKNLMKICAIRKRSSLDTQMVVTTRRWQPQLVNLLKNVTQPLLVFGDFLEAAVYGRVSFCIKFCTQQQKIENLRICLQKYSIKEQRSLIFCNSTEDVDCVVEALTASGYTCLVYDDRAKSSELDILHKWKNSLLHGVVVCMDNAFYETDIKNVHNLIHYSMPKTWSQFTRRFSSISANLENCLLDNFKTISNGATKSSTVSTLILLDEQNSEQLPRLLDFMRAHNQHKHVPEDIIAASKRVMQNREETRVLDGWPLCTCLLEYGNCDQPNCNQRHALTRYDMLKPDSDIPSSGDLQIHIIKVNSPTHYCARLLSHRAIGETTWRQVRRSKEAAIFGMQLNMYYAQEEHMTLFWPLELRKICVYRNKNNYQRAIVLEMPNLKYPDVVKNVYVTVQLLDQGNILSHVQSYDLFACADEFKDFPAQAVNVRLLGIVPYDDERCWDAYSTNLVTKWLIENLKKQEIVHVSVSGALANTIWVKNVLVMERLPSTSQFVQSLNLKKVLLKEQLGIEYANNENINELLRECELQQIDADDESLNLNKINGTNEKTENENTKEEQPIINIQIEEEEKAEENVVETNIVNTCKEVVAPSNLLYAEKWIELPLHDLTAVEIGNESSNGHWKDILLQIYNKTALEDFNELSKLINKAVAIQHEEGKDKLKEIHNLEWLQTKPCCIVRKENSGYLRAKVLGVYGKNKENMLVRFFLCDFADFINKPINSLHDDFLYSTTKEIVEFIPYQAVHCTLTGIDLFDLPNELHLLRKDYLNAYAVLKRTELPKLLQELKINSYEILLYESDDEFITPTNSQMLNQALLDKGYAEANVETQHFLELELNTEKIIGTSESDLEEEEMQEHVDNFCKYLQTLTSTDDDCSALKPAGKSKSINEKIKETAAIEETKIEEVSNELVDMPALRSLHKRPRTIWHETDFMLFITIHAPDVTNYSLEVQENSIRYVANINDECQMLLIKLLGTVRPEYVQHQLRGVNVIIRLLKSLFVKWPRLLEQTDKPVWLSYNLEIEAPQEPLVLPELIYRYVSGNDNLPDSFDTNEHDDSDNEAEMFQTYNPIRNKDDDYDPIADV